MLYTIEQAAEKLGVATEEIIAKCADFELTAVCKLGESAYIYADIYEDATELSTSTAFAERGVKAPTFKPKKLKALEQRIIGETLYFQLYAEDFEILKNEDIEVGVQSGSSAMYREKNGNLEELSSLGDLRNIEIQANEKNEDGDQELFIQRISLSDVLVIA